mgnify:CR=1 FL=1
MEASRRTGVSLLNRPASRSRVSIFLSPTIPFAERAVLNRARRHAGHTTMDDDILQEFLAESWENLGGLDTEIVALEKSPQNSELLASIFRTIHTIKGTCGFIGLTGL